MNAKFLSIHVAWMATRVLLITAVVAFAIALTSAARAQTYQVIHNFTNGLDGGLPYAGLTMDAAGDLYGTTPSGGIVSGQCAPFGCGGVYKLKAVGSSFVITPLHSFAGGSDGNTAQGRVALGQDGSLFGTTVTGGGEGSCFYPDSGCGTVFQLKAPPSIGPSALFPWEEIVLYRFTGGNDGGAPQGDVVFDQSGNLFGVTYQGGTTNNGVIYQLTPAGGGWAETVLYSALNNGDGANPIFLALDRSDNLYGVFYNGGPHGFGAVFQLSHSASGWTEQTLHGFTGGDDGKNPVSLIIDGSGNLYGMTYSGGSEGGGTVFKLTPGGGGWTFSTVYALGHEGKGCNPLNAPLVDDEGDLYATASQCGEYNWGAVFKLSLNSGARYTSLWDFTFGASDGNNPASSLIFDAKSNLYGTAQFGGTYDRGVIFEISP